MEFKNKAVFKLTHSDTYGKHVEDLLIEGEEIIESFSSVRDGVIFTSRRIIAVNVRGVGKKIECSSMPYNKISTFSIETAGVMELGSKLEIFVAGYGSMVFDFMGTSKVKEIAKMIATYCMN